MSRYRQLSIERCELARLRQAGASIRQVAAALDRQPATISRELKRNAGAKIGYQPSYAQLKRTNNGRWRLYLPRAKARRGWHNKGGGAPRFLERRPGHDRPPDAAGRRVEGHWEADAMLFSTPGQAVLIAHERRSRLTLVTRATSLKAEPTAKTLARLLRAMPPAMRQTIPFDNGTAFARHYRLTKQLGFHTFFCDPHSPWQKGGVENAIGRLRRALPRKSNLDAMTNLAIDIIARRYNNTPPKCLGFQTPAETFPPQPLHFKCESTPGTWPG